MKTIKAIPLVILFFFAAETLWALNGNFKGDTIHYKFDKMLVEVASSDFAQNSPEKAIGERIKQAQKILDEMSIEAPAEDERVTIVFRDMGDNLNVWNYKDMKLKREKKDAKNLIVFKDGTIFEKESGRYCICFCYKATDMKIYIEDLADLSFFTSETFRKKAKEGTESIIQKVGLGYHKSPVQAWVDLRGDEPKAYVQSPAFKYLDMLIISGGIGSGWVKNTFVSDLNFQLGLGFSRRGMMKNTYLVDWNMMYDFSNSNENNFFEVNHFLSLGWEHNFSNTPLEEKWYGFSLGYLVKRNNDFFKKNTFRVSVKKKINDTISLNPELYFNDFLKNIYPGIRVSVSF